MASVTTTSFDAALKQLYRDSNLQVTTYTRRPMLATLPKFEGFGGRNMPIVNLYGNAMGRSATFATAQTNATSLSVEDFLLTRINDYSVATIEGEVAEASKGDNVAFLSALKAQIDSAMNALSDAIETFLPRSGTGTIGQVSSGSTVSNQTITLEDINDVTNFEVGMVLRGTSTDGGAYDTGQETLAGVNRVTGVLTATSAAWNTVMTDLAASDFLVVSGDAANAGANIKISGFDAWFPSSAPSATAFFGVDRTADSRLYGQTHDGSSQPIEEALIDGASKAAREGGAPDICYINQVQMRRLIKQLGSKVEYNKVTAQRAQGEFASVGFRGVAVQGDNEIIKVVAANKVQSNVGWMLDSDTNMLATLGPPVKFLMLDGNRILRQSSADGYEVRLGFRGNFGSKAPNWNVRITLPTA